MACAQPKRTCWTWRTASARPSCAYSPRSCCGRSSAGSSAGGRRSGRSRPARMAKLEAGGVRMEYYQPRTGNRLLALEDVTTSIDEGEFVSIVGPSGCGKSTFLKIVDGLVLPSAGKLRLDGRPILGPGVERAMVFQDAALF